MVMIRLKLGNACYHSVQNACYLSFGAECLLSIIRCRMLAIYHSVQNACYLSFSAECWLSIIRCRMLAIYHSVQNLLSSSLLSKNLKIKICSTIILPVVLYGCETWSLTLREEQRLRVFENRVLRRIFGPKKYEVTGEWRKLPNILGVIKSRRMRWAGHVARVGNRRGVYRVLVGKPEEKGPFGRPRRRWEDNIKISSGSRMWGYGLDLAGSG